MSSNYGTVTQHGAARIAQTKQVTRGPSAPLPSGGKSGNAPAQTGTVNMTPLKGNYPGKP